MWYFQDVRSEWKMLFGSFEGSVFQFSPRFAEPLSNPHIHHPNRAQSDSVSTICSARNFVRKWTFSRAFCTGICLCQWCSRVAMVPVEFWTELGPVCWACFWVGCGHRVARTQLGQPGWSIRVAPFTAMQGAFGRVGLQR